MKRKVVLRFKSNNGNEYIYDDVTSSILQWSDIHEEILDLLHNEIDSNEIINILMKNEKLEKNTLLNIIEEVEFWYKNNSAFFRKDLEIPEIKNDTLIKEIVNNSMSQLILSVTDDCNLACKYCTFSDNYSLVKNKTKNSMSKETAQKSIDYFYSIVSNQFENNPKKNYSFTFYGGEPLINFHIIKFSIEYIKKLFKNKEYNFALTTNGILLNEEVLKFLVDNNVFLLVSLDGDKTENDRNRVSLNNKGSFDIIFENLKLIQSKYPFYFNTRVGISSVFDMKTNLLRNNEYFKNMEMENIIPKHMFANAVSNINTEYYNKFNLKDEIDFNNSINILENEYIYNLKNNLKSHSYLLSMMGPKFNRITLRQRVYDHRGSILPTTSTCMIGKKMHVAWDGKINICEKVNGKNIIGDINNGLSLKAISKIINNYNENVSLKCNGCPIQKLCPYCFMHFETDNGFNNNELQCKNEENYIREILTKYVSILEENPGVEFDFIEDSFRVASYQLQS